MCPFLDLRVIPAYGTFSARLVWRMLEGFEAGRFSIHRSDNGVNGWGLLGEVADSVEFLDTNLLTEGKMSERYYKVIYSGAQGKFESPTVATFGELTRREFGAARLIMQREWQDLRQRTKVKLFKLKSSAGACPRCTDPNSGEQAGVTLCDLCWSTGHEGGYWTPPIDTFVRIMVISPNVKVGSPQGAGATDPVNLKARAMAFPSLRQEDLLVDAQADKRYLVESAEVGYFNGKAPVTTEVNLVLLRRNDVRYRLPLS